MTWIPVTENITAFQNQKYLVDTSNGEISVILPQFPNIGTSTTLAAAGDISINRISVLTQTEFPFEDGRTFFIMDIPKSQFEFIFNGFRWIAYNLSRQGVKVSELPQQPVSQISNDDLIPFTNRNGDVFETTSIPFITLKQRVTEDVFTSVDQIIEAINEATSNQTLNTTRFDGRTSDYYLNYTNLTNRPLIPTLLSQLGNDSGFISDLDNFTSDNLIEGQTNKYLSEENFKILFDPAFSEAYRLFSGDFPEQSIRDSVDNIQATPLTTSNSTDFINISNPADVGLFFVGKKIRIYGATTNPIVSTPTPAMGSADKRGFSGVVGGSAIRYKVIQFNFLSGEFSPTSNESNLISNIDFELFNDVNNVSVRFSRTSTEYGVLIYRSTNGSPYALVDVLGQRQLGSAVQNVEYVDYGSFNYVPWSKKNPAAGNVYDTTTGITHFPAVVSSINNASRGWDDATIIEVDQGARRIRIDSALYFNANIIISEDDTEQIQNAINQRKNIGVNSLTLNDRKYIVSKLNVPSNFSIFGRGQATSLRKISWDFNQDNKVITTSDATSANIVLSDFTIDGNMQNQWLKSETGDLYSNYAIDLKEEGVGNNIDRIRVSNIIGGGISSSRPNKLVLDKSRIENAGMSDQIPYSPLIADDGLEVVITNNIFKNFTDAIDISLSDNGVFTSNIIENVGSGVLIYASKFLISAPNLIRGPAGEYIPGPDVINSVFDSVNIKLNPGTTFFSDVYKYQENGVNFDITKNRSELTFRMDRLRLVANVEELYGEILLPGTPTSRKPIQRIISGGLDATQGEFRFAISPTDVNTIINDYSLSTLRLFDPNHMGLVYSANLTEYVPAGIILPNSATISGPNEYRVTVTNFNNLFVGSRVKMLLHGGTPNLDSTIGTITAINTPDAVPPEAIVTISYEEPISVTGAGGQITVENIFTLAKGRVL